MSEDATLVTIENVQEPSSVCSPVPRPEQSMPAESPPRKLAAAQIQPGDNAPELHPCSVPLEHTSALHHMQEW